MEYHKSKLEEKLFVKLYDYVKSGQIQYAVFEVNPYGDYPFTTIYGKTDSSIDQDVIDEIDSSTSCFDYIDEYFNDDEHTHYNYFYYSIKGKEIHVALSKGVESHQSFYLEEMDELKEYIGNYIKKKTGEDINCNEITIDYDKKEGLKVEYYGLDRDFPDDNFLTYNYIRIFKYFEKGFWNQIYKYLKKRGIKRKYIDTININPGNCIEVHWSVKKKSGKWIISSAS